MAENFATILMSAIAVFFFSVVFYAFARITDYEYGKKTSVLAAVAVVTVIYVGSFLVSWAIAYEDYRSDSTEAYAYQCRIQEYLVRNIPELEGVDPSRVVFANSENEPNIVFVDGEPKIIVKDEAILSLIKDYQKRYYEFDYAIHLKERLWMIRELSALLATTVILIIILVTRDRAMERRATACARRQEIIMN